ncbi:MAG: hypothetical protein KDC98_11615, partial [Planctomycetes bacterium]|nr:hypothetical protein [Planctomycetota bacterium]
NARVVLEDRVYVGSNASILPDVRIGEGATIGANTMVAADVPAGATVVGVPGQVVVRTPQATTPKPVANVDSARCRIVEARMMEVLHAVLGHHDAHPTDHFFDVGGTSLLAIQLVESLRSQLGHDIPLQELYARGSIRDLAQSLCGDGSTGGARTGQHRGEARRRLAVRFRG